MKKTLILLYCLTSSVIFSQIIFQEKFNGLTLSTYTTAYTTTQYTTVPSGFIEMSEGYKNMLGSSLHPNAPFHTDSLQYKGWGVIFNNTLKDTFLVSTSWVDTNKAISRWVFLPVISGISVNTVLHWKAMSPDEKYADGYAVYVSNNTSVTDTSIFSSANKVFQISDNSVSGGGEKQQWTQRSISLSNYAGQSIRIAFKNISNQKYQLWIDDLTIQNLPYPTDASIENVGNVKYALVNQPIVLKSRIKNEGYQNISNVQLAYSIQGISYNSQSFSLNNSLTPLASTTLAFTNSITINSSGMYQVKIWINQVNGQTDQNYFNDTISYFLSVINNSVSPKILVEQLIDVSMPDAPANQDTLNNLKQDTNIIVVQIHQQDSMQCNVSGMHTKYFSVIENKPVAMINRKYYSTQNKNYFFVNELRKKTEEAKSDVSPCNINISNINADTILRTIQFDVNTKFYQNANGKYRVDVYVAENNVYGNPADTSMNGFNQLSSYYFTPYSNYFQEGYFSGIANAFVLNAYQYKHQFVLNTSLNGIFGDASVIPDSPVINSIYTKTYTITIPNSINNVFRYNFNNLYLIAFVYEHDTLVENRKILNATIMKVNNNAEIVGIYEPSIQNFNVIIYPNPAQQILYIKGNMNEINGKIFNLLGEEVLSFHSNKIDVSMLSEGLYLLKFDRLNGVKKIIIQR